MSLKKLERAYKPDSGSNKINFIFTTESGVKYLIYTMPGNRIIPGFIFSNNLIYLGFRPVNSSDVSKENKEIDERIMNTVVNFIIDIFQNKNSVILFIPSSEGGEKRKQARVKLFSMMHFRHFNNSNLHKMDFIFPVVGSASMLFRKDNDYCASLCTVADEDILKNINEHRRR